MRKAIIISANLVLFILMSTYNGVIIKNYDLKKVDGVAVMTFDKCDGSLKGIHSGYFGNLDSTFSYSNGTKTSKGGNSCYNNYLFGYRYNYNGKEYINNKKLLDYFENKNNLDFIDNNSSKIESAFNNLNNASNDINYTGVKEYKGIEIYINKSNPKYVYEKYYDYKILFNSKERVVYHLLLNFIIMAFYLYIDKKTSVKLIENTD